MLLTKKIEMNINTTTVKWYENKGYTIPKSIDIKGIKHLKRNTKIIIKAEDLPDGSHITVDVECDGCGKLLTGVIWQNYKKSLREEEKYYCTKCAKNGYEKWISFFEWCYLNLSKFDADRLLSRWDYELNVDKNGNKLSPKDVSYSSNGINKIGYWFKCLYHPEHGSELKSINNFTGGKQSLNCNKCNTIKLTHPESVKYLVNIDDADKYSYGSIKELPMRCPDCGYEKEIAINKLTNHGFSCPKCSDGVPYSEKFLFNFLEQLKVNFIPQLSKRTIKWCNNYRYDNYIKGINCIIETHGIQHYEDSNNNWATLEETQDNDFDKEWLARLNKIKNYIILDCRKSELEWIKNSIMKSRLPILLGFKESDIDWLKCHEAGSINLVKTVCDMWKGGIKTISRLAKLFKLNKTTIKKYLKQGAELSWCDYNFEQQKADNLKTKYEKISKKVICLTTGEVFNSLTDASRYYKIDNSSLSKCCKNKILSTGTHPETNKPLRWMYYNVYILKLNEN